MWSILWRLFAIACGLLFMMIPVLNLLAIPIEIYLVFSVAAIIWRRHARPDPVA